MVTIATTFLLDEALVIQSALEGSGIPSFIPDEFMAQNELPAITASGGVRVQVADENAEAARRVLAAFK
jgi:hypothetical protein